MSPVVCDHCDDIGPLVEWDWGPEPWNEGRQPLRLCKRCSRRYERELEQQLLEDPAEQERAETERDRWFP